MDRPTDVPRDWRQRKGTTLALALLASLLPSMAAAQIDCVAPARGVERPLLVQSRNVGYYGSYDLATSSPDVKRAVIMVHGIGRNAAAYYDTLVASACLAETNGFAKDPGRETILLAPHFLNETDPVPADYHSWKGGRWTAGDQSQETPSVSSYAVIDAIIDELLGTRGPRDHRPRFPNLELIVVAGHSAGGQFTHRYAATNGRDGNLPGIRMRYVVANPSSYLYLNERRPHYDGSPGASVPYVSGCIGYPCGLNEGFSGAPSCRFTYDNWRYGLEDLYPYAAAVGPEAIRERLLGRPVIVLLGMLDNDPSDDSMDTSCPASLQGPHRYARGHRLLAYLDDQFPSHHHFIVEVDDAGHSFRDMFVAPPGGPGTGSAVLFYDW